MKRTHIIIKYKPECSWRDDATTYEPDGRHAEAIMRIRPSFRVATIGLWKNYRHDDDQQHLYNALKDAGLPE